VRMKYLVKDKSSGRYKYQRPIDPDLQEAFGGKRYFTRSLSTTKTSEAHDKWAAVHEECDRRFAAARAEVSGNLRAPSSKEVEVLAEAYYAFLLEEDEEERKRGPDDHEFEELGNTIDIIEAGHKRDLAKGKTELIEFEMEDFLRSRGFGLSKGTKEYQDAAFVFLKTFAAATSVFQKRQQGEWVDTPRVADVWADLQDDAHANPDDRHLLLSEVTERYLAAKDRSAKNQSMVRTAVRRFSEHHGDLPVNRIERSQVVEHRNALRLFPSKLEGALREMKFLDVISATR